MAVFIVSSLYQTQQEIIADTKKEALEIFAKNLNFKSYADFVAANCETDCDVYKIDTNKIIKAVESKTEFLVFATSYGNGVVRVGNRSYKLWAAVAQLANMDLREFAI